MGPTVPPSHPNQKPTEDMQHFSRSFRAIRGEGRLAASTKPRETSLQVTPALTSDTNASRASIPVVYKEHCHGNKRDCHGNQTGLRISHESTGPFPSGRQEGTVSHARSHSRKSYLRSRTVVRNLKDRFFTKETKPNLKGIHESIAWN